MSSSCCQAILRLIATRSIALFALLGAPLGLCSAQSQGQPIRIPIFWVTRVWGWSGESTDSLVVGPKETAVYVGHGYGPREGRWEALIPLRATDSLLHLLGPALLTAATARAAELPPGAIQICEVGPLARFVLYPTQAPVVADRRCYRKGDVIDSLVDAFVQRPEWHPAPSE